MITYYLWSEKELLGFTNETNVRAAEQKAHVLARMLKRKSWTVSIPDDHGRYLIVGSGLVKHRNHKEDCKFNQIVDYLTQAVKRGTI